MASFIHYAKSMRSLIIQYVIRLQKNTGKPLEIISNLQGNDIEAYKIEVY